MNTRRQFTFVMACWAAGYALAVASILDVGGVNPLFLSVGSCAFLIVGLLAGLPLLPGHFGGRSV